MTRGEARGRTSRDLSLGRVLKGGLRGALRLGERLGLGDASGARLVRRWFWTMNRNSRSEVFGRLDVPSGFDALLARASAGETLTAEELLPYLSLEGRRERAAANALLAEAYAAAGTEAHTRQAGVFVRRAWLLSGFERDYFWLYLKILSALGDTSGIREGYKRLGVQAAGRGDASEAIDFFSSWQNAYGEHDRADRFEYDFDVMDCVDALAAPRRFRHEAPAKTEGRRVRVAYLLKGAGELNSILVRINRVLAEHHDRERFDVMLFTPETESQLATSPQGVQHAEDFRRLGCTFTHAPEGADLARRLHGLAESIHAAGADVLVTSAGLADFRHYFVAALGPAPVQVGLLQGPPAQFAPPLLDWCIAWTRHPMLDCPVDCTLVPLNLGYEAGAESAAYTREELGLPAGARVLLSGGRPTKFQDRGFWRAIAGVLRAHEDAYYLAVGPREDELPFLKEVLGPEVGGRVRCLGWREDFLRILPNADVVIDTYPSGGGQVIVQAVTHAIPVVGHRNDYLSLYDQTRWTPIEDFVKDPSVLVESGDFEAFARAVSRLLTDEAARSSAGERARASYAAQENTLDAVRRCEEVYLKLVGRAGAARAS